MLAYAVNPLADPRWKPLLLSHPAASVFHTPEWLTALERTYGYEQVVVTTCAPAAKLSNGVVLCRVNSLLTGSRLVSVPFSDHCEPLGTDPAELDSLLRSVADLAAGWGFRYSELRPLELSPGASSTFAVSSRYFQHRLALTGSGGEIFGRLDKDCVQRKVRRAERERLRYEEGCSEQLISEFYRLQVITRRRHRLPPQPAAWFRELFRSMGENAKVRVAFKGERAIASIVTLRFKNTMVYKYGSSDAQYHNLGGLQMLLWRAIEEAIGEGLTEFDFGRSDLDNESLATFKDRWGAKRSILTYWTSPAVRCSRRAWSGPLARRAMRHAPAGLLSLSGRLLYRHLG